MIKFLRELCVLRGKLFQVAFYIDGSQRTMDTRPVWMGGYDSYPPGHRSRLHLGTGLVCSYKIAESKYNFPAMLSRIFISPDERRLRAGWRLLTQALIFTIFAAIASILIFPALPEGRFFLLVEEVVRLLAITIPIYLARRFLDRRSFVSLGVAWRGGISRDILVGFLISGVSVSLLFTIFWAMGWVKIDGFAWQVESWSSLITGLVIMLLIFAMTAWAEELQARGYWLQNLEEGLNLGWAFILSSLFFSLTHFLNSSFSWMAFLGLFVGGFDLAYGYIRTRQLWLPIGLHLGWNFFEGTVYGFAVSGWEGMPSLVLQSVSGPELWTGGAFGPEAGLLMILAVGVNIGLIYWFTT